MSSLTPSEKLTRRDWFDIAIRFALGVTFAFAAGKCIQNGIVEFRNFDPNHIDPHQWGKMLSMFAIGLYTMMIACLYAVRLRPISRASGAWPCAAAILGGFLMSALLFLTPNDSLPLWSRIGASALVIIGNIFAIVIILNLGKSFSILPESRKLVTNGPYAFVRHPLYLAEAVVTLGVMVNFLSVWALVLVIVQISLQLVRIHYEEKVLKETFPEYEDYAKKTWRILPGVY